MYVCMYVCMYVTLNLGLYYIIILQIHVLEILLVLICHHYHKCSLYYLCRTQTSPTKKRTINEALDVNRGPAGEDDDSADTGVHTSTHSRSPADPKKNATKKKPRARPITHNPIISQNEDAIAEWVRGS